MLTRLPVIVAMRKRNKSQGDYLFTGLPSLTRFACDTREYVFSHAHTQMNENHTRIGKLAEKC